MTDPQGIDPEDLQIKLFAWLTVTRTRRILWAIALLECLLVFITDLGLGWHGAGYVSLPFIIAILVLTAWATRPS